MKEQLLSFPIVFSVDQPFFLLVQACWLVDHEKFDVSFLVELKIYYGIIQFEILIKSVIFPGSD